MKESAKGRFFGNISIAIVAIVADDHRLHQYGHILYPVKERNKIRSLCYFHINLTFGSDVIEIFEFLLFSRNI